MNNQYISKYAKNDTHFARTDPFKYVPWQEEEPPVFKQILQGFVFLFALFLVLLFIAVI